MHFNYPGFLIEIQKMLENEKGFDIGMRSAVFYIKHIDQVIKELKEKISEVV